MIALATDGNMQLDDSTLYLTTIERLRLRDRPFAGTTRADSGNRRTLARASRDRERALSAHGIFINDETR